MTVHPSILLLVLAFISGGCQEEVFDRHLLVRAYWQLEKIETAPELIADGAAIAQMRDCEKDDAWKFATNGMLKTYRGAERCYPKENFTDIIGGWTLSGGGHHLSIREAGGLLTNYRVLSLSTEELRLQFRSDEGEIVLTYQSIPANLLARDK